MKNRIKAMPTDDFKEAPVIVTSEMLQGLPEPVRRYLTYSGVVGTAIPATVRLQQTARIRDGADKPWMNLNAEQNYTINPPSFIWIGTARKMGLPVARATDSYQLGKGRLQVKFGCFFTLFDATGPEMDQGELMRYLNEMSLWFPAALLGKNISFEFINDTCAKVTLSDSGKTATAKLFVDEEGKVTNFEAIRYRTIGKEYALEKWSTPIADYAEFEGLKLARSGSAVYKLETGDFEYIQLAITALEYNP